MDSPDSPLMLPGFTPAATTAQDSGLRAAALATIDALRSADLLNARHALTAQLLLATAERAGIGLQQPKTSIATTNLLRLLADLLEKLPTDDAAISSEADAFLRALAEAEAAARSAA